MAKNVVTFIIMVRVFPSTVEFHDKQTAVALKREMTVPVYERPSEGKRNAHT